MYVLNFILKFTKCAFNIINHYYKTNKILGNYPKKLDEKYLNTICCNKSCKKMTTDTKRIFLLLHIYEIPAFPF